MSRIFTFASDIQCIFQSWNTGALPAETSAFCFYIKLDDPSLIPGHCFIKIFIWSCSLLHTVLWMQNYFYTFTTLQIMQLLCSWLVEFKWKCNTMGIIISFLLSYQSENCCNQHFILMFHVTGILSESIINESFKFSGTYIICNRI